MNFFSAFKTKKKVTIYLYVFVVALSCFSIQAEPYSEEKTSNTSNSTTLQSIPFQEGILNYNSLIKIDADGYLDVTEQIEVLSTGVAIKHGIYRDFPTHYKNAQGKAYKTPFHIIRVLKDGIQETYSTSDMNNGERIKIGSAQVTLRPGKYTYTIIYRTGKQLRYFSDFDELYWNVTGNGWIFPIAKVRCAIELPPGAEMILCRCLYGFCWRKGY